MKNIKILALALITSLTIFSCGDDEEMHQHGGDTDFAYHAHINSPDSSTKNLGDMIHVHVVFESHSGETVHHVNVRVYNKSDNTELFNGPADAHVHETSGKFEIHQDIMLSEANGATGHSDWVVEAKVWGHEAGDGEVIETQEFHVHP